ncbi:MAG: PaaI family thioesterase [Caulobacterales bacterium]
MNINPDAFFTGPRRALFDVSFTGYFGWAGLQLRELRKGFAEVAFRPREEMLTPWDTLNGAVINGLMEHPSFLALLTELQDGEMTVTNDVFVQHLRPLPGKAEYVLRASVIRRGKLIGWTSVETYIDGTLSSRAQITKSIVQDKTGAA